MKPGLGENILLASLGLFVAYFLLSPLGFVSLISFVFGGIYLYLAQVNQILQRVGIPGPKPRLLFGNLLTVIRRGVAPCDTEWMARYGKVYGTYQGTWPTIAVADPKMLKQILIKEFWNFSNFGQSSMFEPPTDSLIWSNVSAQEDEKWKWMRSIITPAFTTGKLKHLVPIIQNCVGRFNEVLADLASARTPININKYFGGLTMDIISAFAFGQDVDSTRNPDNDLIKHSRAIVDQNVFATRLIFVSWFPIITQKLLPLLGIHVLPKEDFFKKLLEGVLEERRANPNKTVDFLQLLLNSNEEYGSGKAQADLTDLEEPANDINASTNSMLNGVVGPQVSEATGSKKSFEKQKLSDVEIMAQSFIFLVAGYHTTALTLTFAIYELARNQTMQDRCVAEIAAATSDEGSISYDGIRDKLPYLESVVWETLRFYTAAPRTQRMTKQEIVIEGVTIPAKTIVVVPTYAMHHSKEFFPDPDKFDPDRFASEEKAKRDQFTFLPFGAGPRHCIANRFVMTQMKVVLASVLQKLRFVPHQTLTERPPLKLDSSGILKPVKPIWLNVELRS